MSTADVLLRPVLLVVVVAVVAGAGCGARTSVIDDEEGCGDGYCTWDEDASRCPVDCSAVCGDELCTHGESSFSCPSDCGGDGCGDGVCDGDESAATCPADCASVCGDGACTHGETEWSCPTDCTGGCGNGVCDGDETRESCPADCGAACGDGLCDPGEGALLCPEDCPAVCGDGSCTHDESDRTCPADCGTSCGNGVCDPWEDAAICPSDCEGFCGDGLCTAGEDATWCPEDCGALCGDGECSHDETAHSCPADCPGYCGDGACSFVETHDSCPEDCPSGVTMAWEAGSFIDLALDPSAAIFRAHELTTASWDDGFLDVPLDFAFPFYGATYRSARVATNGYVTFGSDGTDWTNDRIPDRSTPNAFIAAFWDDLDMRYDPDSDRLSRLLYSSRGTAPNRHVVIQWDDFRQTSGNGSLTFEVILHENGTIQSLYHDVQGWDGPSSATGSSATVGIEDDSGARGVLHGYSTPDVVRPGTVLTYRPVDGGSEYTLSREDNLVGSFRDIQGEGFDAGLRCDDCTSVPIPLGFNVSFFETRYSSIVASSNGWISFGDGASSSSPSNLHLPSSSAPRPLVACFWDDGDGTGSTADASYITVGTEPRRTFILQYTRWAFAGGGAGTYVTYQARVHEATGVVDCLYGPLGSRGGGARHLGSSATVGIQDGAGSHGIEVSFEEGILEPGSRIAFFPADDGSEEFLAFGPDPSFVDIRNSGRISTATGDDSSEWVDLGFGLDYFGDPLFEVSLTTNGQLNLDGSSAYWNEALPSPGAPSGVVAPYWDDLFLSSDRQAVLHETRGPPGDQVFIAQWHGVALLSAPETDLTFQVRLHEADGLIEMAYGAMLAPSGLVSSVSGADATVGLQDRTGTAGVVAGVDDGGVAMSGGLHRFVQRR